MTSAICSGSEAGSYLRRIDVCITQRSKHALKQGKSRSVCAGRGRRRAEGADMAIVLTKVYEP